MYRIATGTTHGLADTDAFVRLLGRLRGTAAEGLGDFFDARGELTVARAPGRLDLMGGIADYSGSLVLELPTASATHVALQTQEQRSLVVASLAPGGEGAPRLFEMPLPDFEDEGGRPLEYADAARYFERGGGRHWASYVAGAFLVLMREKGFRFERGARLLVGSSVPEGKGVSSSAALEVATMRAIDAAYGVGLAPRELAFLCQKVENMVACAPCGVMDQMTSACGEADRLLALLCQPAELLGNVALPEGLAVWGVDSGIRHSVGGADYGTVRTAAFMGYRIMADAAGFAWREAGGPGRVRVEDAKWGGYLANVTPAEFEEQYERLLPERLEGAEFLRTYKGINDPVTSVEPARVYPVRQAARHPVYEHDRVKKFSGVLQDWRGGGQAEELGALMYESHESYTACGLGSGGTDLLVRLAREAGPAQGLYGAKITGGGSGGTVAVLGAREAGPAVAQLAARYAELTGRTPLVLQGSSPGAAAFGHLKLV